MDEAETKKATAFHLTNESIKPSSIHRLSDVFISIDRVNVKL